jgi:hypothetical protein
LYSPEKDRRALSFVSFGTVSEGAIQLLLKFCIQIYRPSLWQQGLDSFVFPRRNFGRRDWRSEMAH